MAQRGSHVIVTSAEIAEAVGEIANEWRGERAERQARRHLEREDFDRLREAGYLEMAVPEAMGAPPEAATAPAQPGLVFRMFAVKSVLNVPPKVVPPEKSPMRSAAVGTVTTSDEIPCTIRRPS